MVAPGFHRSLLHRVSTLVVLVGFLFAIAVQTAHVLSFDREDFSTLSARDGATDVCCDAAHCQVPEHRHLPAPARDHDHKNCVVCHSTIAIPASAPNGLVAAADGSTRCTLQPASAERARPHLAKNGPRGPPLA